MVRLAGETQVGAGRVEARGTDGETEWAPLDDVDDGVECWRTDDMSNWSLCLLPCVKPEPLVKDCVHVWVKGKVTTDCYVCESSCVCTGVVNLCNDGC